MKKNQIYKAFQQERYQIEERLKRFKEEVGGGGFSGSWNDLTDKPFETIPSIMLTEAGVFPDNNGELSFSIGEEDYYGNSVKLNFPVIVKIWLGHDTLPGSSQLYSWDSVETPLRPIADSGENPPKIKEQYYSSESNRLVIVLNDLKPNDLYYLSAYTNAQTKYLDEQFIPDTIARVSDVESLQAEIQELREMVTALQTALANQT